MLLRFSIEGYKMYMDRATLNMEAAPKQKDLEYSLLYETVAGRQRKGTCTAVIYGPNAAGKSALVTALADFRGIVGRGGLSADGTGRDLSLVPCSFVDGPLPTTFEVAFTRGGSLYEYSVTADLGRFGRPRDPRRVVAERLSVDGHDVFSREGDAVAVEVHAALEARFAQAYVANRETADALLSAVEPSDLFLDNGFRTVVSPTIAREVSSWFSDDLMVVTHANEASVFPMEEEVYDFLGTHFTEAAGIFGASGGSLAFLKREGSTEPAELYTAVGTSQGTVVVPSDKYESLGTTRFLNMLPFVEVALSQGKVLVMDELDASLHPMAVMSIVNAFHDDGTNRRGAQLIFTTHNPILLDGSLFRRDEIKIVDPGEAGDGSVTYALSDFGTAGSAGVRRGEDYQRNYFMGRYGGIRDVDLVPFLREQVERGLTMDLTPEGEIGGDAGRAAAGEAV